MQGANTRVTKLVAWLAPLDENELRTGIDAMPARRRRVGMQNPGSTLRDANCDAQLRIFWPFDALALEGVVDVIKRRRGRAFRKLTTASSWRASPS
jgi:hypothetical protein